MIHLENGKLSSDLIEKNKDVINDDETFTISYNLDKIKELYEENGYTKYNKYFNGLKSKSKKSLQKEIPIDKESLEELMKLIKCHFIAMQNGLLFRENGVIKKETKIKNTGLSEKDYEKMFELYNKLFGGK